MFKELFETKSSSGYELYHDTYTSAIQEVKRWVNTKGYDLDDEQMTDEIGLGPGKPKSGKTVRHTLDLYKNGKKVKEKNKLHVQIYNRGQNRNSYELNAYIA